jgi:hypothetical protein
MRDLAGSLDFGAATAAQISHVVFGEQPLWGGTPEATGAAALRDHFMSSVLSDDFQRNVIARALHAFPALARDIFVHVPKCAGTDLVLSLAPNRLCLPHNLEDPAWTTKDALLQKLSTFARFASHSESVFISGHIPVSDCIKRFGLRPHDRMFTIIRDPVSRLLSSANYAVSRLVQDPRGGMPDTQEILGHLGLDELPANVTRERLADLALQAMRNPLICEPNLICRYLSDGTSATYSSAMEAIVRFDIEVTTTAHYPDWLSARWALENLTWSNRSEHYLSLARAQALAEAELSDCITEDVKLFKVIEWGIARSGSAMVRGRELARLAGPKLVRNPALLLAEEAGRSAEESASIIVAQGDHSADEYVRSWPPGPAAGSLTTETPESIDVGFGLGSNLADIPREGWSGQEPDYTWSVGPQSMLLLPRPAPAESYELNLHLEPFVHEPEIALQRLSLQINGKPVFAARIPERVVLQIQVSRDVIQAQNPLRLVFDHPDAARPSDITGFADDRVLAFSVRRLMLRPRAATP